MPKAAEQASAEEFRRLFRRRQEGWQRFEQWSRENPHQISPQAAWSGIAGLYELLPPESRRRPVDTEGVRQLHRALARMESGPS